MAYKVINHWPSYLYIPSIMGAIRNARERSPSRTYSNDFLALTLEVMEILFFNDLLHNKKKSYTMKKKNIKQNEQKPQRKKKNTSRNTKAKTNLSFWCTQLRLIFFSCVCEYLPFARKLEWVVRQMCSVIIQNHMRTVYFNSLRIM